MSITGSGHTLVRWVWCGTRVLHYEAEGSGLIPRPRCRLRAARWEFLSLADEEFDRLGMEVCGNCLAAVGKT